MLGIQVRRMSLPDETARNDGSIKKYLPLIAVEGYLLTTLLILYLGPVKFKIHNQPLFIVLMFLYHSFFIFGYLISLKMQKFYKKQFEKLPTHNLYYISLILGLLGIVGTYNNLMLSSTLIPYDFIDNLTRGFSEPGLVYAERMMNAELGVTSGSRFFNIASFFFSFLKLLFIFQFVYNWKRLGKLKKLIAVIYSFFFVSSGIAAGTNSVIFIFFIFLAFSMLITLYINGYKHMHRLASILGVLFLIPVGSFGYIMSQRGGGFDYFATTSPLGDISAPIGSINIGTASLFEFFRYSFVWLDYYLVQGYYGFSLIINKEFNWTFGFGNSAFLQRQLLLLTGIDITPLTYQHRISPIWDESAQWHSFYGQFANDFSLIGLVVLMFLLGYLLAKTWASIIYNNSFYGAALMPVYMLMFIFFPANNQVFAYIDTLSYFIFVNFLWMLETKKARTLSHV